MQSKNATVLVVDDEEAVLAVAGLLLEELGYRIVLAKSGTEGWHTLLQATDIDLVITDVNCKNGTDVDGIGLATLARDQYPELPLIFMTGGLEGYAEEQLTRLTPHRILRKPFRLAQLKKAVEEALAVSAA